jgi:hypothetical protein
MGYLSILHWNFVMTKQGHVCIILQHSYTLQMIIIFVIKCLICTVWTWKQHKFLSPIIPTYWNMNVPTDDRFLRVLPDLLLDAVHVEQQVCVKSPGDCQLLLLTKQIRILAVFSRTKKVHVLSIYLSKWSLPNEGVFDALNIFSIQTLICYIKW